MRDYTKLRAFELADEIVQLIFTHCRSLSKRLGLLRNEDSSLIEPQIVETEKILNGLIRWGAKGSPKNKFVFSGVEAPAWQGARRANSRAI